MPAHIVIAMGFALILTVGFGIVLREISDGIRQLHEDERAIARLVLHREEERMRAEAEARAKLTSSRPVLPVRKPRALAAPTPVLLLPPPTRAA